MGTARSKRRYAPAPRRRAAGGKQVDRSSPAASLNPIRFTIASDRALSHQVQERILEDVQRCGYDEQSTFAIKVALEEAMTNAIKHGNKF
jgi:hypothetical protein